MRVTGPAQPEKLLLDVIGVDVLRTLEKLLKEPPI
jgi:hypothetical protein